MCFLMKCLVINQDQLFTEVGQILYKIEYTLVSSYLSYL